MYKISCPVTSPITKCSIPGYQTFQLTQYSLQMQTHISNEWKYVCVYKQPLVNRQPLNPKSAIYAPK